MNVTIVIDTRSQELQPSIDRFRGMICCETDRSLTMAVPTKLSFSVMRLILTKKKSEVTELAIFLEYFSPISPLSVSLFPPIRRFIFLMAKTVVDVTDFFLKRFLRRNSDEKRLDRREILEFPEDSVCINNNTYSLQESTKPLQS